MGEGEEIGIEGIKTVLAHRYPFLMVDRVLELGEDRIRTLKNVTVNEPFFLGHFPDAAVLPGVLILEGMAQSAGIWTFSQEQHRDKRGYFAGVDRARFRKPVVPGDQLIYEVQILRERQELIKAQAEAFVDGEQVAEAVILFTAGEEGVISRQR
ncbi:MAG: 3-hydroxyacyl-ACP dehydratase FabZ [Candidatus Bipolaricaulia bacterium]